MIARPAAAALSCRSCQHTLFRAVLSSHSAVAAPRSVLTALPRRSPAFCSSSRLYSTHDVNPNFNIAQTDQTREDQVEEQLKDDLEIDEQESGTPWYLEVDAPRHPDSQHAASLPKPPQDSPELLEPLIKYVYEDMGLDDLALLDLREIDPPAALGPNLIMLFATARSERHLHVSAGRFVKWLRKNHKVTAKAGGLIGPGELKTKLRRLRKKAKLLGTNTAIIPGGDNGISTGWVCVSFTAPGGQSGETTRLDEEGKFSGFGSALTGTTVVIQCMTEPRRLELDLESLWQTQLKRSLRAEEEVKGQGRPDEAKLQELVNARVQMVRSESSMQWDALQQASRSQQQRRHFSTSMRRMNEPTEGQAAQAEPEVGRGEEEVASPDPEPLSLADLQKSIQDLQNLTQPIPNEAMLSRLLSSILIIPLAGAGNSAAERLELLDQVLLTAHERGMKIMSTGVLVTLIDGLVRSPSWGEETQRAQKNMEMLLMDKRTQLSEEEAVMLMQAHASRQDWERFWNIFNWNTRFAVHRPFSLYGVVFGSLAATGDSKLCMDALRTVWPEFRTEQANLAELETPLALARECVLVADSASEQLVDDPPNHKIHRGAEHKWWRHHEGRRLIEEIRAMQNVSKAQLRSGGDEKVDLLSLLPQRS
ncbi:ribosomal silencing factor during starvation domain-containing protein [Sarocladium implicatum]|nr:ribosomal silencing factor during starvation domain-containing protein [Sarocladium implicatum]